MAGRYLHIWMTVLLIAVPFGLGAGPAAAGTIDDVVDTEEVNATDPVNVTLAIEAGFDQDTPPMFNGERGADASATLACTADPFNGTDPVNASGCQEDRRFHSDGVGRPVWVICGVSCRVYILPPIPYAGGELLVETGAGDVAVDCTGFIPLCTVDESPEAP